MFGWKRPLHSLATRLGLIVLVAGLLIAAATAIGAPTIVTLGVSIGAALATAWMVSSLTRPFVSLVNTVERISRGEEGEGVELPVPTTGSHDEVSLLARSFAEMKERLDDRARRLEKSQHHVEEINQRLREQNEELQSVNEVLEQLSITDGLTKLHNHRFFQEHLAREAKRADRSAEPLGLVLIDIDRFKQWNDYLGHAAGDQILRRVADVMSDLIRETDMLARYGGEEFALIVPNADREGALQLAEKIRATVSQTDFVLTPPSEQRRLTVSIGVAIYDGDRAKLFNEADRALYDAKAQGRDCVIVAEPLPA